MRKRNGFQKMLSVALALLMAVSLFSVAASAEQTFRYLNTYSDVCQSGEYWFDSYSLAQATGETGYHGALFNISEDNNTIRVMYTPTGGTYTTEYHNRETEPAFFAYLHVVPEFVLLPTSPNGLENGAYWFDKADLIDKLKSYYGETYQYLYFYEGDYYLSVDGTMIRKSYTNPETGSSGYSDDTDSENSIAFAFLKQVGVDPNAGFTLLPKSEEGLNDGEYWFDVTSLAEDYGMPDYASYLMKSDFYLSDDGNTLRQVMLGMPNDFDREENAYLFTYLRQKGVDPNAGFTLLPTSDEGLETGAYWFDAAGIAEAHGSDNYLRGKYYLSDDGKTLRIKVGVGATDVSEDESYAYYYFSFLKQAGIDPNAGFVLLPTSEEGLDVGAYWFDAAGLVSSMGDSYQNASYYLSEDGETLRIVSPEGFVQNYQVHDEEPDWFIYFLHQAGIEPTEGFVSVAYDINEIECEGYLFQADVFADDMIESEIEDAAAQGKDPYTDEELAAMRTAYRKELDYIGIYYRPSDDMVGLDEGGTFMSFGSGTEMYEMIMPYLQLVENHAWDDGVVTTEPTAEDAGVRTFTCKKCGATMTEAARDVFWAGYEHQFDDVTLDEGDKPAVEAHNLFIITKKDTLKVQLRFASGSTLTFSRDGVGGGRAVTSISDVVYDGAACELWVVDYALGAGTYTAVAKMKYIKPLGNIRNEYGCTFEIDAPTYGTAVYSASIGTVDPDYGYILFDGTTKQVITIVTGTDVQKVQLRNDETGSTLTYNGSNATITEDTRTDGTPVLVWTIERLFARGEYSFSVYTRSVLGLNDSGKDLAFKVDAMSDNAVLVSVDVAVDSENRKDVFTVVTQNTVSKVKFTDTQSGATMTVPKAGTDKYAVAIRQNEDSTMTWTITTAHHPGRSYDCQALLGNTYTGAKQVSVPADPRETLLFSVTSALDEAAEYVTFTVVTHKDAAKVKLTNRTTGGVITALPGGNEKVAVSISDPDDAGQKTWTITVRYLTSGADVTYDCQAFIGATFFSDVLETTVNAPVEA